LMRPLVLPVAVTACGVALVPWIAGRMGVRPGDSGRARPASPGLRRVSVSTACGMASPQSLAQLARLSDLVVVGKVRGTLRVAVAPLGCREGLLHTLYEFSVERYL